MQTASIKLILMLQFSFVYLEYLIQKALVLEIGKLKIIFFLNILFMLNKNLNVFHFSYKSQNPFQLVVYNILMKTKQM